MAKEGKSSRTSLTIWAGLASLGTGLSEIVKEVVVSGLLPTHWQAYAVTAAGLLTILGRVRATEPITKL